MKYSIISLLLAISVTAIPLEPALPQDVTPVTKFEEVVTYMPTITRRMVKRVFAFLPTQPVSFINNVVGADPTVFHCQRVTPNTAMPTQNAVLAIASYLEGLGDTWCGMSRPAGNHDPVYQNLVVSGNTEVNMYFTPGKDALMQNVIEVNYACKDMGRYLRLLFGACNQDSKAQGWTEIPNCPNKKLVWAGSPTPPDQDGGASIEVMPIGTRHGSKRKML
jgi:hypothetical protein